jgi:hypothetical protein
MTCLVSMLLFSVYVLLTSYLQQAYTNELENKVSRLEEENERLKRQKVLPFFLILFIEMPYVSLVKLLFYSWYVNHSNFALLCPISISK